MDALRRNQYLQTMGVDVWVPRHPAAGAATVPDAAITTEASAVVGARPADSYAPTAAHARSQSAAQSAGANVGVATGAPRATGAGRDAAARKALTPTTAPISHFAPSSGAASPVTVSLADGAPTVTTWESLRSEVLACTKCPLHGSRTQGVFGVGNREAQWLVVGEAPGAEEDRRGEPFVGRAGHLLDAMLKAIGLSRGRNVYIANVLKSRPPGNRDPKPEEVAACLPYLMRQIELLRPRVMLAVGRIAAQNLLATDTPLGRLRGKVHHFGELNTPLIVTYHPAYLLRTPGDKRKAWEDLKFARSVFQRLNPTQ
jgi:uracil-DNA glycosylase family 4